MRVYACETAQLNIDGRIPLPHWGEGFDQEFQNDKDNHWERWRGVLDRSSAAHEDDVR